MGYAIDIRQRIPLGGMLQTIHIWGTNLQNPVLLFLHGGPGIPNRHTIARRHLDLTDAFTVVAWDQRGTGGSWLGCDRDTLTLEQLVSDCGELLRFLCTHLEKEKIFLICGSWGTELGTFVCRKYPELVAGYIGYGQVVNGIQNEALSFDYTLRKAREADCEKDIAELLRVGPPVDGQYKPVFQGLMTQRRLLKKYGGNSVQGGSYLSDTVMPILKSGELTFADKLGTLFGYKLCLSRMWPEIVHYDFIRDCCSFQMPYFIFQGRKDHNTPSELIQAYYDAIEAPKKALVWFEHSAHGPLGEEPEKFKGLVREVFGGQS